MTTSDLEPAWQTAAILIGRLIFAGVFLMAAVFKYADMEATGAYIAAAWFPFPYLLAWLAAIFECVLVFCFVRAPSFQKPALWLGFMIFLAFVFHGPSIGPETRWSSPSLSIISPFLRACCLPQRRGRATFWHGAKP